MCVIIVQKTGTHLDKETAKRAWLKNPDGGGFAYITDAGTLHMEKFMEWKSFWPAFENARSLNPGRDFLVHMRIATHGEINLDNVHPYKVNEFTVMAHNGIIHGVPDYKDGRSDTKVFVDEVLPSLPSNWLDRPYLVAMVEKWVGWSKLAFLSTDVRLENSLYILNEDEGHEVDGMWMSNTSPLPVVTRVPTYSTAPSLYRGSEWELPNRAQLSLVPNRQQVEDKMIEARLEVSLFQEFIYDEIARAYVCFGCDEELDSLTYECQCWSKLCKDCDSFAAECECMPDGMSNNLVAWEEAEEELQETALNKSYVFNQPTKEVTIETTVQLA